LLLKLFLGKSAMEPLIVTASAIASLVFTETAKKLGNQLSTKAMESSQTLLEAMRQKYPEVVEQESKGQLSYRQALAQIEIAVEEDPEIAKAVIELGEAVKSEPNQEILFQILSNVIIHLQEEPRQIYNVQYNFPDGNVLASRKSDSLGVRQEQTHKADLKQQSYNKQSKAIGFYFSILSLILVGFLVFIPLSIGIQQVLVALIALFLVFSLSAFKRSTRYVES
jgi:hypothetical protein